MKKRLLNKIKKAELQLQSAIDDTIDFINSKSIGFSVDLLYDTDNYLVSINEEGLKQENNLINVSLDYVLDVISQNKKLELDDFHYSSFSSFE